MKLDTVNAAVDTTVEATDSVVPQADTGVASVASASVIVTKSSSQLIVIVAAAVEAAKAGLQDGSIVVSTTSADCPAFILQ